MDINNSEIGDLFTTYKKLALRGALFSQNFTHATCANVSTSNIIIKMSITPKEKMLAEMHRAGFNGKPFRDDLESVCERRRKRGKGNKKNRYDSYMKWAVFLYKKDVGMGEIDSPKYAFPASVLAYIRNIVPGDIKGEIREDAFPVTIEQFCDALQIPPLE